MLFQFLRRIIALRLRLFETEESKTTIRVQHLDPKRIFVLSSQAYD